MSKVSVPRYFRIDGKDVFVDDNKFVEVEVVVQAMIKELGFKYFVTKGDQIAITRKDD